MNVFKALLMSEVMDGIVHEFRLLNSVWNPITGRFHPDNREDRTMSHNGKMLSNIFQNGQRHYVGGKWVSARTANRAIAASALRQIRRGEMPSHKWTVLTVRGSNSYVTDTYVGFDESATLVPTIADYDNQ